MNQEQFGKSEFENNYEALRIELIEFLNSVGEQVLRLRKEAETDPNFSKLKEDGSIVTNADILSEDLIRKWISQRFPTDTIRGEEKEKKEGGARTWIIDPIDGTYNFKHTGDKFGVSVGMIENNVPKLGCVFFPAEDITISAVERRGALINGSPIRVSEGRQTLSSALILADDLSQNFDKITFTNEEVKANAEKLVQLLKNVDHDELEQCYTFAFLKFLKSDADALIHFNATPYDIAAVSAIARELKMEVSDFKGQPIDFSQEKIPIVISKNPQIHKLIVEKLNL